MADRDDACFSMMIPSGTIRSFAFQAVGKVFYDLSGSCQLGSCDCKQS